ncbi:hypothetical protein QBC40DRAFT_345242 [Triangularia verruculosa]|uniref:Galactose oxidase n=1 Tax=Triangularia verruculosa TaxID=2587418 RepID=A0AAN6XQN2_9PEZI|nr:hypothetical protein QBC40DRAFT_345242 [Triangularia verruculosa]
MKLPTLLSSLLLTTAVLALPNNKPNPRGGKWQTLPSISDFPRQEHVTLALSPSSLAIFGGILPANDSSSPIPYLTTNILQIYSIPDKTWSFGTPAPLALNHPNAAVVNGKIYLLGGATEIVDWAWRPSPRSFVYDPKTNAWSDLPPIPESETPRGSAAMGVHNGIIYLAGGLTILPLVPELGPQQTTDVVSAFDTKTNKWLTLPASARKLPEGRDHAAAAVYKDKFYVLGGRRNGQDNVKDTVFELDLKKLSKGWTLKRGRMPTARGGLAAARLGGKVYTLGGEGNKVNGTEGVFPEVEVYDVENDRWERLRDMEVPRHGTSAVGIGGGMYVPGGGIRQGGAPVGTFDVFWP